MAVVTMRYWAAAKQAAGVPEETVRAGTLAEALTAAREQRGSGEFEAVLARSSLLVDGEHASTHRADSITLCDGAVIEVLPPFAGG